jgi:hypothetical protein
MDDISIATALAKLQVTQDQILSEIKDLKPRVTWLETKANYYMGGLAGLAVFGGYILNKLGLK